MVFVAVLAYGRAFVLCRKARPRAVTASARHAEAQRASTRTALRPIEIVEVTAQHVSDLTDVEKKVNWNVTSVERAPKTRVLVQAAPLPSAGRAEPCAIEH